MWIEYNPNPCHKRIGDCVIRALSKVFEKSWLDTYLELAIFGAVNCDMMSSDALWGKFLKTKGFTREIPSNNLYDFYTVEDFCRDNPKGTFILAVEKHVLAVVDGNYYDAWQSGDEEIIYIWSKK